jgi:hypothetical protein
MQLDDLAFSVGSLGTSRQAADDLADIRTAMLSVLDFRCQGNPVTGFQVYKGTLVPGTNSSVAFLSIGSGAGGNATDGCV